MAFDGIHNIIVPSFDRTLRRLDPAGIEWDVEQAVAQGFAGTLLALNAGLAPSEMLKFLEIVIGKSGSRLRVGVEMPLTSFAVAHDVLEAAGAAGADHTLFGVPQGFLPADDGEVYDSYAPLAEIGLPVVLPVGPVGFPMELGGGIPWGAWARLAPHERVTAVHVSTWMPQQLFAALRLFSGRAAVGIGTPLLLGALPLLHREYGVSWLSPAHWELWQSPEHPYLVDYLGHVLAGRSDQALDVHWRLAPARGIAFGGGLLEFDLDGIPNYSLAKYLSWTAGSNGGVTREPALHLQPQQQQARAMMLRTLGIESPTDEAEFLVGRSQR
ncbi:MAG: hypothetical protein JO304_03795 [Solirubrobacterales bacterium]|nr:hypothetical protein [Solirubrobacterales bacterium]